MFRLVFILFNRYNVKVKYMYHVMKKLVGNDCLLHEF